MWLDEYHVDGLRFDGTAYIHSAPGPGGKDLPEGWSLLQWINNMVAEKFPDRITIAEDLQNNNWVTKDVEAGPLSVQTQLLFSLGIEPFEIRLSEVEPCYVREQRVHWRHDYLGS